MADEISHVKVIPRKVEGTLNQVMPVASNIPVTHNGRKIGTAEVDQSGHVVMEITDEFDQSGIFRMFANGEAESFSLGVNDG